MRRTVLRVAASTVVCILIWWILSRYRNTESDQAAELRTSNADSLPARQSEPSLTSRPSFGLPQDLFIAGFEAPIRFFGKVVDQHGQPVVEANVKVFANDKAGGGRPSETSRQTDAAGNFSITGIRGLTLAVEVAKPGYRVFPPSYGRVTSSGLFEYGLSGDVHRSSKGAPTIFVLHKIGPVEPLVKVGESNLRIARDGTPLSISVDQEGRRNLVLRCWNEELIRPEGQRQYNWRLEISVPGGGLLARKTDFEFEAPERGYLPNDIVDMPILLKDAWRSFAERSYFIRFEDGTFARANLRMRAAGDHFVVWQSYWNSKPNSPNLESDPLHNNVQR